MSLPEQTTRDCIIFGRGLSVCMKKAKRSQGWVCRATGITENSISNIINGRANFRFDTAMRLSRAIEVSVDTIYATGELNYENGKKN